MRNIVYYSLLLVIICVNKVICDTVYVIFYGSNQSCSTCRYHFFVAHAIRALLTDIYWEILHRHWTTDADISTNKPKRKTIVFSHTWLHKLMTISFHSGSAANEHVMYSWRHRSISLKELSSDLIFLGNSSETTVSQYIASIKTIRSRKKQYQTEYEVFTAYFW